MAVCGTPSGRRSLEVCRGPRAAPWSMAVNAVLVYYVEVRYVCNASLPESCRQYARSTLWVKHQHSGPGKKHQPHLWRRRAHGSRPNGTAAWEIAALESMFPAWAAHLHGNRKAVLVKPNQGTGMEGRWEGRRPAPHRLPARKPTR
jgi:hypothetical protein